MGYQQLIDTLTADDPEILTIAIPQDAFQLVQVVTDDGILHVKVGVPGQNDVLSFPQRMGVWEGLQRLAPINHGLMDCKLPEAVQIRGNGNQQLAILSNAPVGGNVYDSIHIFLLNLQVCCAKARFRLLKLQRESFPQRDGNGIPPRKRCPA